MTFANLTNFAALDVPVTDPTGRAMVLVVVKGTFDLQENRLERQAPVCVTDVPSAVMTIDHLAPAIAQPRRIVTLFSFTPLPAFDPPVRFATDFTATLRLQGATR